MVMDVKEIYQQLEEMMEKEVVLQGWIRNHRKQKEFGFIDFNDGTFFKNIQLVYDQTLSDFEEIQKLRVGASLEVRGKLSSHLRKVKLLKFMF